MVGEGRMGRDLLFLQNNPRCCMVILKFKYSSHWEVIQIILIYVFHIVCIRENKNAERRTGDCQTFFVVNHISTKRASYRLSRCLCVAMIGKKLQTGSSLVLWGSLQRNIRFQSSSKMTEAVGLTQQL